MMRLNFSVIHRPFSTRAAFLAVLTGVAGFMVATSQPVMAQGRAAAPAQTQQAAAPANPNAAPFPPLSAAEQQRLDQILAAWEQQSKGTKTLECDFKRWHFDLFAAPAGIYANKAEGVIKYANPDKGLFQVKAIVSYDGMDDNGKPKYSAKQGLYGEHWVCTGTELKEFDHATKQCKIQQLPPDMQGQRIIESPLPFVFNADAKRIKQRYWVQPMKSPDPGFIMIAAYPKHQADRAQYKAVQIILDGKTFLPHALRMFAPNFNEKTQPKWDHYEFTNVKRNSIQASLQKFFMQSFIEQEPPSDWKVFRDNYNGPPQLAEGENEARRQ
ncbi:TIGR03009 domain-containing protein [Rhodopirellula europaea]|uniref:TIGR03009 domain-containing protein n=1 Tax=Rhodopirellula europaea TaxID=1263866 RepID=UPI003D26FE87|tara:strand:- start:9464 stop:10444 length:981 start_codon:yes stop_codon:yes gene_type:complete